MRHLLALSLLVSFAACSSSPDTAPDAPTEEQQAAIDTDVCLDNPDLARQWGECNVKHTLFLAGGDLAKCRRLAPKAKSGALNFQVQVKRDGSVGFAKASPKSRFSKLEACISKVMKKLKFARPPAGTEPVITVPYQLAP